MNKFFEVLAVTREDIEEAGFTGAENWTDEQMEAFAYKMSDIFPMDTYWMVLDEVASRFGLKPIDD